MLEYINDPNDIKRIQPEDYKLLAKDIRRFLLKNVSRTGGHLASNLGIVELTMALHLVLDFQHARHHDEQRHAAAHETARKRLR